MAINKNFTVDAGIEVGSTANVGTTLGVGGNTTVGGTLAVTGNTNLTGVTNTAANVNINGAMSVTGNVNVGGSITGPLTIAGNTTFSSNVTISGNLTVSGTTTFINTATLAVADNMITLNSDWAGAPSENAGIEVNRGTSANVQFMWDETADVWSANGQGIVANYIGATANVYVGANSYINTTAHFIGNSSINTTITATNIGGVSNAQLNVVNAASVNATTLIGVGANTYTNTTAYFVGNSTVNTTITSTNIGGVSNAQLNVVNAATVNATTLIAVGANTYANTTAYFVGNSTVNTTISSTNIGGSSNAQLNVVNAATVNATTLIGVGANSYINTTAHFVGNSTVNSSMTAASLAIGPSSFSANTTRVVIGTSVGVQANGTIGSAGQVLHSNGTSVYWDVDDNTEYDLSSVANTVANEGKINLTGTDTTTDTVKFIGQAEIGISSNSTAVYVDHNDVVRANNTSTASPASGGTFTAIDSVTTNARGHVTAINTKTVTLPVDPNTTYSLASVANTAANAGRIRLTDSSNANDDVIVVGAGTTTVSSNSTQITITSADQYVGTVTSVSGGNGLTGSFSTSGSISVLAGTGIVANATGTHVNSAYVATVTVNNANNADYLDGQHGSYYAANSLLANYALLSGATFTGGVTFNANATFGASDHVVLSSTSGISANGSYGSSGQMLTSNGTAVYWSSPTVGTVTSVSGGNGLTGTVTTTGSLAVGAGDGITVNADSVEVNANSGLIANTSGLFVNASSIAIGTVPAARLPSGSTTAAGILQLTDSTSSTSTTTAATPNAVKSAYDLAFGKAANNQTMYLGTTAVAINRASAAGLSLAGVNIDGSANNSAYLGGTVASRFLRHTTSGYTSGNITVSSTQPGSPAQGDIWFDLAATTGYTQNLAAAGYTKLPNGLYIQWGQTASYGQDSGGYNSFYTAFPNACLAVVAIIFSGVSNSGQGSIAAYLYSTTQFYMYNGQDVTSSFKYIAIGY